MKLSLVEVGEKSSQLVKLSFSRLLPGSAAVLILQPMVNGIVPIIYYEGGKYYESIKDEYAKIAAGRAIENYPTIARFSIPKEEIENLKVVGTIDTDTWEVTWN